MRRLWLTMFVVAALGSAPLLVRAGDTNNNTYTDLDLFGAALQLIHQNYVTPVSDDKLIAAAINGMLSSLDPHSNYLDPESYKNMQIETKGEFGGLGMEVTMKNGLIEVVSPIDGTPAARGGLKAGDLITAIDGTPILGLSLPQAVDKLRGPVHSNVKLTIRRDAKPPFSVTLAREVIKVHPVHTHLYGRIGYLRISVFSEQADAEVRQGIAKLRREAGGKLAGLVLDLRNDPGGLLDQAVAVGGDFLAHGEVVSTRGRRPEDDRQFYAHGGDVTKGLPMAVLINGGTASASEIVAGALHDHHRAVILGTRSFGKGTVQTIIPISGHGALRLTTARYYTPSGRSIQEVGIEPDIVVRPAKLEYAQAAPLLREKDLPHALKNPDGSVSTGADEPAKGGSAKAVGDAPDPGNDYQLQRALDLLEGLSALRGSGR
jgi:carboxyl-terminal processing protease